MNILHPGMKPRATLDKIQADIRALQQEITEVADASTHPEEVRAQLRASLEKSWGNGPHSFFHGHTYPTGKKELPMEANLDLLVFLFGVDDLVERIMTRLAPTMAVHGLPSDARAGKVHEMQSRLGDIERNEEREVLRLERAGHVIIRRADARPEILFEVWDELEDAA